MLYVGKESGSDQQNGLKQALQPGQSPEACSATLVDKRWAQFQQSNREELGQIKRLGMDGRYVTRRLSHVHAVCCSFCSETLVQVVVQVEFGAFNFVDKRGLTLA